VLVLRIRKNLPGDEKNTTEFIKIPMHLKLGYTF